MLHACYSLGPSSKYYVCNFSEVTLSVLRWQSACKAAAKRLKSFVSHRVHHDACEKARRRATVAKQDTTNRTESKTNYIILYPGEVGFEIKLFERCRAFNDTNTAAHDMSYPEEARRG